jgi:lipopolysaccharide biosynthesis glycosyltransferase
LRANRPDRARLHLACAARSDYLPHGAAMLHSVLGQTPAHELSIHFLHGADLPPDAAPSLTEMVERLGGTIEFLEVSEAMVAGLRTRGDFLPASHWYRVFLPQLLPALDKLLYLDVDIIAVDSIVPLWETELGDHYLAAVTNVFQHDHLDRPAQLGLADPRDYFNSGVLLMNLDLMRRDDCTRKLIDYAQSHHELLAWPEQDALNVVLGQRRLALHPRWNAMNSVLTFPSSVDVFGADAVEEARRNPALRHFEGPFANKPWHYMCDDDMRDLYFEHRRQTPWPRVRVEGRTPANVARRGLRRLRLSA